MKKNANAQLRTTVRSIVEEVMGVPPDQDRVNTAIMGEQIKERLGDLFFEMAMEIVHNAEEKIMTQSAAIINQHNMMDTQFGRMTTRSLRQTVEDFDENIDDKMTLMQECASDIEVALEKFATQLGDYIAHIVSPSAR